MSTITFDTLKFAERLEKAGVPRGQAKAEALLEVFETGTSDLPTKNDLTTELGALRAEIREMRADMMSEIRLNRWMLAAIIGLAVVNFAKQFI